MTPGPRIYLLHGLRVRSAVPLAGEPLPPGGDHDVDVLWGRARPVPGDAPPGTVILECSVEGASRYVATAADGQITLRVPGVCDFALERDGAIVECKPDPAVDPGLVGLLVGGLVVAFVLGLAGHCVLHASAVEVEGSALAFAGASGSGKSTLAALLCAAGAGLVTDDVLRLEGDGAVRCVGGTPQIRLRPQAAWTLERFRRPPSWSPTVDGRLALALPSAVARVRLAAIVVVNPAPHAREPVLRRLRGPAAAVQLTTLTRVLGWREPALARRHFERVAAVAGTVPVLHATIPWGPARAAAIVPPLIELVRSQPAPALAP